MNMVEGSLIGFWDLEIALSIATSVKSFFLRGDMSAAFRATMRILLKSNPTVADIGFSKKVYLFSRSQTQCHHSLCDFREVSGNDLRPPMRRLS